MKKLLLLVAMIALCLDAASVHAEEIRFCRMADILSIHVLVAEKEGFFRDAGLEIVPQVAATGKLCQDNLLAAQNDFILVQDGPISYIGFEKNPVRVIAAVQANPELMIYARKDHGIAKLADLRGKRIGYLPGTVTFFYVARLLDKLELTREDVNLVTLQAPVMPQALLGGMIDAYVAIEQWGGQSMKALGDNGVRLNIPDMYNMRTLVATTDGMIKTHPETVAKVLRALLRAEGYIKSNPADAIKIVAGYTPLDIPYLSGTWDKFDNTMHLDADTLDLLNKNAGYIVRYDANYKGLPVPDYSRIIDHAPLRAVSQEKVSLP